MKKIIDGIKWIFEEIQYIWWDYDIGWHILKFLIITIVSVIASLITLAIINC